MTDPDRFSEWFDKVSEGARASPIGEIMVALGYDVEHTDGARPRARPLGPNSGGGWPWPSPSRRGAPAAGPPPTARSLR